MGREITQKMINETIQCEGVTVCLDLLAHQVRLSSYRCWEGDDFSNYRNSLPAC